MGRKRIKQYLMLLLVVGVIAVVASGGGGTFASFSAETTNNGNYFATGTLILNDNGGTTTCSSASSNTNFSSTDCDTLFTLSGGAGSSFTFAKTSVASGTVTSASTTMTIAAVSGAPIYKNDKLCFTSAPTDCVVSNSNVAIGGSGSINITATGLSGTYTTGAGIVDNTPTSFAKLTLQNAGTLDASGISFKSSTVCSDAYGGGNTTLNMGTVTAGASSGTTLTVASSTGFVAGDSLVVAQSGHAQTFVVSSIGSATTIVVTAAQNWNFAYTTAATVTGPRLNGGSPQTLCANLKLTMTETDSSFNTNLSTAQGCAYTVTVGTIEATNACDFTAGQPLSTLPTSLTSLTLASAGGTGNTGALLSKGGGTRYFLIAVHYTGSNFDNTYQNIKTSTFNLTWHIDQA